MKTKQHLIATLLAIPLLFASCQKQESASAPSPAAAVPGADLKAAYALCREYDDVSAAASLAYQLTVADPENAVIWKEELAKIHYATQRYASCLKIITDLSAHHGGAEKLPLLEMAALCQEAVGNKVEATASWKTAWGKSASSTHAVRLAGLQFEAGSLGEAEITIASGLNAADSKTATISLPKSSEEMQQIPTAAALHNLMALLVIKKDPKAQQAAKDELEAALALAPDFEIAKRNLKGLETPPRLAPPGNSDEP